MQDYNLQLSALKDLLEFLNNFYADLYQLRQKYQNLAMALHEADVPIQVADKYIKNYWQKNDMTLWNVIANLKEMDYPYIQKQIEIIEEALIKSGVNVTSSSFSNSSFTNRPTSIKKICVLCKKEFETTFQGNQFCPTCFAKILKKNDDSYNGR